MSLLKDLAVEVWERIRMGAAAAGVATTAMFFDLKADAASSMQSAIESVVGFGNTAAKYVRGRLRGDQGDLGTAARRHRRSGVPGGQQPGRRRRGDAERRGLAHQRLHRRHQPGARSSRVGAAHLAGAGPRPRRDREPLRGRGQCCHDSCAGGVRPGLRGQPAHRARSRPDRSGEPGARVRQPLPRRRARPGGRGPRPRSKAGRRCAMRCVAPTRPVPMR